MSPEDVRPAGVPPCQLRRGVKAARGFTRARSAFPRIGVSTAAHRSADQRSVNLRHGCAKTCVPEVPVGDTPTALEIRDELTSAEGRATSTSAQCVVEFQRGSSPLGAVLLLRRLSNPMPSVEALITEADESRGS
jgi:hypothetical protein